MDISDLRAELHRRASRTPPSADSASRIAAVAGRVRARRQRAIAGVAGLAAAGVGVAAFVVTNSENSTTEVEPASPALTQGTVAADPVDLGSWPTRVDGNPLVVKRLTRHSVHSRTWTVTAPTLDLSVSVFCRLKPEPAREDDVRRLGPIVSLSVNGHSDLGISCGDSDSLDAQRPVSELNPRNLREYGVHAGEPFDVTLEVGRNGRRPTWRAQLGLGLYARTGDVREVAEGWSIPVVRGVPGDETTLTEVFTAPVRRQGGELIVTTRGSTRPGSRLTFGWLVPGYRGRAVLTIDGVPVQQSQAGGIVSDVPFEGRRHRIVVRTRGGVHQGTLMLALYEPGFPQR